MKEIENMDMVEVGRWLVLGCFTYSVLETVVFRNMGWIAGALLSGAGYYTVWVK